MTKKGFAAFLLLIPILAAGLQGQFARTYGGPGDDVARRIWETTDGGFITFSYSVSFTGQSSWLVKVAADGAVEWQKAYSLAEHLPLDEVCETADGGYLLVGPKYADLWLIKVDGLGEAVWEKAIPCTGDGSLANYSVCPAADAGFFVIGTRVTAGNYDVWVIKLSSEGSVVWQKAYDSGYSESGTCAAPTAGGGCVIAGWTDGAGLGGQQALVFEIDGSGVVIWQRGYSSLTYDASTASLIRRTADGGFLLLRRQYSGWDPPALSVLKMGETGAVAWEKTFACDGINDLRPAPDGGSIVAGTVGSGDEADILVMKLSPVGDITWQRAYGGPFGESGWSVVPTRAGDYAVAGATNSFGAGNWDLCVLRLTTEGELGACRFSRSSSVTATTTEAGQSDVVLSVQDTNEVEEEAAFEVSDTSGSSQTYQLCSARKVLTVRVNYPSLAASVTPAPGSRVYDAQAWVAISGQSPVYVSDGYFQLGFKFSNWEGDATGTANPLSVRLDDDMSVRAAYTQCAGPDIDIEWGDNAASNRSWDNCGGTDDGDDGDAGGGGGCFVATAAYRSPLHPAVKLLREFRDRRLLTNGAGRAVVAAYYRWSPPAARAIAGSGAARFLVRVLLVPAIAVAFIVLKIGWVPAFLLIVAALALLIRGHNTYSPIFRRNRGT